MSAPRRRVLVVGCQPNGLGIEICKKLLEEGCAITVHDSDGARAEELGKQLAEYGEAALLPDLADDLSMFDAVCFTDTPRHELCRYSELCHLDGRVFVAADVFGLLGSVFVDRGGEAEGPRAIGDEVTVESMSKAGVVHVDRYAADLKLRVGDYVVFSALRGQSMDRLNGRAVRVVEVSGTFEFRVGLGTAAERRGVNLSNHVAGSGVVGKSNSASGAVWTTLREAIVRPSPEMYRASVYPEAGTATSAARSAALHIACQGVHAFRQRHGMLPMLDSVEHAAECARLAEAFLENNARVDALAPGTALMLPDDLFNPRLAEAIAHYARRVHPRVREVVARAVANDLRGELGSTAFRPGDQFLYVDALGVLPESKEEELPLSKDLLAAIPPWDAMVEKELAGVGQFVGEHGGT